MKDQLEKVVYQIMKDRTKKTGAGYWHSAINIAETLSIKLPNIVTPMTGFFILAGLAEKGHLERKDVHAIGAKYRLAKKNFEKL